MISLRSLLSKTNPRAKASAGDRRSPAAVARQGLRVGDQLADTLECDMVELSRGEIATSELSVEPGQAYRVLVRVDSTSTRQDAAMVTFSLDAPLTPEDALKYFPRFTPAVGKPFAWLPNVSDGVANARFTAPPGVRRLRIAGRRWAEDGTVKIGTCLTLRPEGEARTVRFDLPAVRLCELMIDTHRVTHLRAVEPFTIGLDILDAQGRAIEGAAQAFRCAAYPGPPAADATLAVPIELPAGAAALTVTTTTPDDLLAGCLRLDLRAVDPPVDRAAFVAALRDRMDRRAADIRTRAAAAAPDGAEHVDGWLCSEKAAVLQRAATLLGPQVAPDAGSAAKIATLPVVPGTILEVRLAPVLVPELREPRIATLTASFVDREDKPLPHAGSEESWSRWSRTQYPLTFEAEAFDGQLHFAAPHYIVVPPRAELLTVEARGAVGCGGPDIQAQNVTVYDNEIGRLLSRAVDYLVARSEFLTRLARCLPAAAESSLVAAMQEEVRACRQHLTLMRSFLISAPDQLVWQAAGAATSFDIDGLPRLLPDAGCDAAAAAASASASKLRVGVIGSRDFVYYLSVWHDVTPLTPDIRDMAAAMLPFDIVVLQHTDRPSGGWPQAFFGYLDGTVPASTLEFVRSLRGRGIPVVLVADPSPVFLPLIRNWADEVDWLAISGPGAEDKGVAAALAHRDNLVRFPVLVETRLHRPVIEVRDHGFGVLCSSLSDLFDFRGNIEYLERIAPAGLVIADRLWRLVIERVKRHLQSPNLAEHIFGSASTEQWGVLCRHAAVALFFEDSLLPRYKTAQIIAEAIANGAVAVYVGDASLLGELADSVVAVETPYQLALVLRQLRFDWHREQVWLQAFRHLHRQSRFERFASWLKSRVIPEMEIEPRAPKATMITVSKRPHLLEYCVTKFREQTYLDVELVLVLNTDAAEPPAFADAKSDPRIRIYTVPSEFNIGYCLNMAISVARGEIWCKCDDDDFYGRHYVEGMVNAFHYSGADIVGKPQAYTYFEDLDAIFVRATGLGRERSVLRPGNMEFLTGATLSGKTATTVDGNFWFSNTIRLANDSEWVRAAVEGGLAAFFSDRNSFVAYRAADVGHHTWSHSNEALRRMSSRLAYGARFDLVC
jgi:hypothetical protein